MTIMLCAALVQAALLANGADTPAANADATPVAAATAEASALGGSSYAEARRTTEKTGKPIVIMVSTDWCQPCQMMKRTILPRVGQRGLFRKVAFTVVNPDHDSELAEKITGGGPIPQLVMFRKTTKGWMRTKLIGSQSVEAVEDFINEGLASNEAEKKAAQHGNQEPPKADEASARQAQADMGDDSARHG